MVAAPVHAEGGDFSNDGRFILPDPTALRLNPRARVTVLERDIARGPGKDALQGVQIAAFATPVHFRPGPVDAAVVRVVVGPVVRQHFSVRPVQRMDIVASRPGVAAVALAHRRHEAFGRLQGKIIVLQNGLVTLCDHNLTRVPIPGRLHERFLGST